jgi:hypothetical protein
MSRLESEGHATGATTRNVTRLRGAKRLALLAGVVAALLGWGLSEPVVGWFHIVRGGDPRDAVAMQAETRALDRATTLNATLVCSIQGAVLGLMLGAAGAAARRSVHAGVPAAGAGLVCGAGLGALAAFGAFTAYMRLVGSNRDEILSSLLAHEVAWAPMGAAAGLAFGLGLGGRGRAMRALAGGFLGAATGAALYEIVGSIAFPLDRTGYPVASTMPARLLASVAIALGTALGAAFVSESEAPKTAPRVAESA